MPTNVHKDDHPVFEQKLQCDPRADVDRHRMQLTQGAAQTMETQGRMRGVEFQQLQGFFILWKNFRMALLSARFVHSAGNQVHSLAHTGPDEKTKNRACQHWQTLK